MIVQKTALTHPQPRSGNAEKGIKPIYPLTEDSFYELHGMEEGEWQSWEENEKGVVTKLNEWKCPHCNQIFIRDNEGNLIKKNA